MATGKITNVSNNSVLDSADNNYIKFPDGTMIQWGMITTESIEAGTTVTISVTYIIPFTGSPSARVFVTKRTSYPHYYDLGVSSLTNNGFKLNCRNESSSTLSPSSNWFAIGRWK